LPRLLSSESADDSDDTSDWSDAALESEEEDDM
jgi:hypothetical protein